MKTWKHGIIGILAIIALIFALNACKDEPEPDPEQPSVPQPVTITDTDGLVFEGTVKISTSDKYLVADWNAVVQKVVAALNRGYGNGSEGNSTVFGLVFNSDSNIEVVVSKSATHNVEVKPGEPNKLYLKESSLDTVAVKDAVWVMSDGLGGDEVEFQAKAKQPAKKGRVFLLLWDKTFSVNIG